MSAERIAAQAIELCIDIHTILAEAYGGDLHGSARGSLVSSHYLARIRDRFVGYTPERPVSPCASCIDLRGRLRNCYHLTITYADPVAALGAVREASGPGAPAPVLFQYSGTETEHGRCGVDCLACAAGAPARRSNA